jgi:hypothetical protein
MCLAASACGLLRGGSIGGRDFFYFHLSVARRAKGRQEIYSSSRPRDGCRSESAIIAWSFLGAPCLSETVRQRMPAREASATMVHRCHCCHPVRKSARTRGFPPAPPTRRGWSVHWSGSQSRYYFCREPPEYAASGLRLVHWHLPRVDACGREMAAIINCSKPVAEQPEIMESDRELPVFASCFHCFCLSRFSAVPGWRRLRRVGEVKPVLPHISVAVGVAS